MDFGSPPGTGRRGRLAAPSSVAARWGKGPWRSIDDLEIAVAEYIDWFNHRRLHGEIGLVPPVEFEAQHHHTRSAPCSAGDPRLHQTRYLTTPAVPATATAPTPTPAIVRNRRRLYRPGSPPPDVGESTGVSVGEGDEGMRAPERGRVRWLADRRR